MLVCSLNLNQQCKTASFSTKQSPKFSADFPKWDTQLWSVVVMAWWVLYILIHSIWRLSNTFYLCGLDMELIPCWFGAPTNAQCHPLFHISYLRVSWLLQLWPTSVVVIYHADQSISPSTAYEAMSNTFHIFGTNVEIIPCGFGAINNAHCILWFIPDSKGLTDFPTLLGKHVWW